MKLDPTKLQPDETVSNHMVQGYSYTECPVSKKGCFGIVCGFGTFVKMCEYFEYTTKSAACTQGESWLGRVWHSITEIFTLGG